MLGWAARQTTTVNDAVRAAAPWIPLATAVALGLYAVMTVIGVRALSIGLH